MSPTNVFLGKWFNEVLKFLADLSVDSFGRLAKSSKISEFIASAMS